MPRLHLVRHARPLVDPATPPHTWELDPAGLPDLAALAVSGRLPDVAAVPEWEPLAATRERLLPAVRRILAVHPAEDIVLVGHGTAWTLLVSELTASPPDLDAWAALRMPDVWRLDVT
jgi:broad specificity phosphatase PhoE